MQFIFPLFLAALSAIIIPILIHLFYFQRYKTTYFSNVGFLKNLKEEKRNRSRLKNILVLLARIFFITFLILAFAQPFIKDKESTQKPLSYISIFIDNSYSMAGLSSETPNLQVAINKAVEIVEAYDENTAFQILTNDLLPGDERLLSKELAIQKIDEIDYSSRSMNLQEVHQFIRRAKSPEAEILAYWISDFQKNGLTETLEVDSSLAIVPLPLFSITQKNLSIDSCWFASPVPEANIENLLFVKVTNYGESDQETKIVWKEGDQVRPLGTVFIEKNQSIIDTIRLTLTASTATEIKVEITDHPIAFDNSYFMSLDASNSMKMLTISPQNPHKFLTQVLKNNPTVEKFEMSADRMVYSDFLNKDLLVLDHLKQINSGLMANLNQYLDQGGNVLIFPPRDLDLNQYNQFLNQLAGVSFKPWIEQALDAQSVNFEDFIFNDVFDVEDDRLALPRVQGYYELAAIAQRPMMDLLTLRNGAPMIVKLPVNNGFVFLSTSPLDMEYNSLGTHADIFVPMVYRMAMSKGSKQKQSYVIGESNKVVVGAARSYAEGELTVAGDDLNFIPGFENRGDFLELFLYDQIKEAGVYQVMKDNETVATFAMNYARQESNISTWSEEELQSKLQGRIQWISNSQINNLSQFVQETSHGKILWKWCLIFALIFLVVESLLLRFMKN